MTLILRSRTTTDANITTDDLFMVFIHRDGEKRGKWISPRTVLSVDQSSWIDSLISSDGRTMNAELEKIWPSIEDISFAENSGRPMDY